MLKEFSKTIHTSLISDEDIKLFQAGTHRKIYEKMGAQLMTHDGMQGTYFAVWAPNAKTVAVVGDFNYWQASGYELYPRWDHSGIWEGFIPNIDKGTIYKYSIHSNNGRKVLKGDPYGKKWEHPPSTASIVWEYDYQWQDKKWLAQRKKRSNKPQPYSAYEVHLESWRKKEDGTVMSYHEIAETLVPYVNELGFTHVELMPIMEYPYSPSWGYQITGYYAASSRFGDPEGLMYLVDSFHQAGIGVLLDWVPSHFPTDAHGLADFDGTHLYDHEDPRKGFHPDWKSAIFNYGRHEVRSFLISNAIYWCDQFHIDGLRVDAVASMLYLDYSREEGEWEPNEFGGNENNEAIQFIKLFNEAVYDEFPDIVTIAEESTSWSGVSQPTYAGGLGFGQKWMMGWMHDTLKFFKEDPINRKFHHDTITFSQVYAYSENFMLPLSHDEVVHGKCSLLYKMPGDEWQKFANLRMMYAYMYTHPGSKLLFMGGEFAQSSEWNFKTSLDWNLLQYPLHKGVQHLVKDLNHLYKNNTALYENQFLAEGFEWIDFSDRDNSVIVYLRKGKKKSTSPLVVICNFTPVPRDSYEIGIPKSGSWKVVLNSDDKKYGGSGSASIIEYKSKRKKLHGQKNALVLALPPLSVLILRRG